MRLILAALLLVLPLAAAHADGHGAGFIVKDSALTVTEAVARIEAAIEAAPPKLMARIDHGANAQGAGLELGQSVLLVFGAPKVGTPIMQANRMAGLDLPAKILVWDEGGQTKIGFLDPAALGERHGVAAAAAKQLAMMAKVLDKLSGAGVE